MIALTRANGFPIVVNADLIELVERLEGQTVVTLTSGNTLAVTEEPAEVLEAVVAYRRRIGGL
jgi:uncharacterized protein YlzI (FlbEa/FlbD family)